MSYRLSRTRYGAASFKFSSFHSAVYTEHSTDSSEPNDIGQSNHQFTSYVLSLLSSLGLASVVTHVYFERCVRSRYTEHSA